MPDLKRCSICEKHKAKSMFYKDKQKKDGLSCRCKDCVKPLKHEAYLRESEGKAERRTLSRTEEGLKLCTKCNTFKTSDSFSRDKQKKDGLRSSCKKCESQKNRQAISGLAGSYIRGLLSMRMGVGREEVTDEAVEIYRLVLMAKRKKIIYHRM